MIETIELKDALTNQKIVKDFTHAIVKDADGAQSLLSKEDLASVVGGLVGGMKIKITPQYKQVNRLVIEEIESKFQNTTEYTAFEGSTMSSHEGFWIGYKHGQKDGTCLFISERFDYFVRLDRDKEKNDGTWNQYFL